MKFPYVSNWPASVRPMAQPVFLCSLAVMVPLTVIARDKKDQLFLNNGDHWTCEIKKLERGYLYVSLDYVDGTVSVDWSKVVKIESPQLFLISTEQGTPHVGTLHTPEGEAGKKGLDVGTGPQAIHMDKSDVTDIEQTEANVWQGLHASFDGGLNFTKSNSQTQFNFNASTDYRRQLWALHSEFHSTFSAFSGVEGTSNLRNDWSSNAIRLLPKRSYFAIALTDFLKSDEQQLNLRTTLGGGIGRYLIANDRFRLTVLGGGDWIRERYTPGATQTSAFNSAEALLGSSADYFRFKSTSANLSALLFLSLTDPGRYRFTGNLGVKYEIIKDLFFNFSIYLNYDSQPPRQTVKSDYGASSSIGWSF
jgi:uncharacterized protein DUF481